MASLEALSNAREPALSQSCLLDGIVYIITGTLGAERINELQVIEAIK
jgi:hypothetical protein